LPLLKFQPSYNYGDQIHSDELGRAYSTQGGISNAVAKRLDDINITVGGNENTPWLLHSAKFLLKL